MPDTTVPTPFTATFQGWSPDLADVTLWPNTVTVETVEDWAATFTGTLAEDEHVYADHGNRRHLVEIDTNYKPGRTSEYPVRLTRLDALRFAAAVLAAVDDTFNPAWSGTLRPAEATELLPFADEIADRLARLREHAEADGGTTPMTDPNSEEC